jgi:hypothetical protein
MQEEIVDETDKFVDNMQTVRVNLPLLAMSLPPELRKMLHTNQMTIAVAPGAGQGKEGKSGHEQLSPRSTALQQGQLHVQQQGQQGQQGQAQQAGVVEIRLDQVPNNVP